LASAKGTLSQMFSWCPLGSRRLPIVQPQTETSLYDTGISTPAEPPIRRNVRIHGAVPDMRQCEPWRRERLHETAANHDTTLIERLSR
jgi:hypothetical protein